MHMQLKYLNEITTSPCDALQTKSTMIAMQMKGAAANQMHLHFPKLSSGLQRRKRLFREFHFDKHKVISGMVYLNVPVQAFMYVYVYPIPNERKDICCVIEKWNSN